MKKTLKKVGRNPMKKNNKRTKKGAIIALCMAGAIAISGAFAFLSDSESAINRFTFADEKGEQTVDVRIDEPNWREENGQNILPLDTVAKDPKVVNDGENDVYAFVTVLVPTAKSINLNRDDGTLYTAEDVELFRYTVNKDWVEVNKTAQGIDVSNEYVSQSKLGETTLVLANANAITNKKANSDDAKDNIYFTAHTYAYTGVKDGTGTDMARVSTETSSVFDEVTMINIADGNRVKKTLAEVKAGLVAEDGTTIEIVDDTIVATKLDEETGKTITKVLYRTVGDAVVDENDNIQYKTMSQFVKDNNINIYVDTYAIQADNLSTAEVNAVWDICVNTTAGAGSFDYFRTVTNDVGLKQAFAPATSA